MTAKFFKSKISWFVGSIVLLLIAAAGAGGFILSQWFWLNQPRSEKITPFPEADPLPSPSTLPVEPAVAPATKVAPVGSPPATQNTPSAAAIAAQEGALRISNPTDFPVRIAVLRRRAETNSNSAGSPFDLPAHWDFAPQEGSLRGLIVSLPGKAVKVKPGDIITAFAQDGSRRYWGPYVIGETPAPEWNREVGEWKLTLQP